MGADSDLIVNAAAFDPKNASEAIVMAKAAGRELDAKTPRWYHVGAAKYREMEDTGETQWLKPKFLPGGIDGNIPSRDKDRTLPIRTYKPDNSQPSKGVLLYFHAGGWTVSSHRKLYANGAQLTVVSLGYRLGPEDPHPAAVHDGFDAAEYLVDHAEAEYGAPLVALAGASAGAHLAVVTAFGLLRTRPSRHRLAEGGLLLWFGQYDLAMGLPSAWADAGGSPGIDRETMLEFHAAFVPGMSDAEKRQPLVSPLYDDLAGLARAAPSGALPPALFLCGADDLLLDDTLLMSARWQATGSPAQVRIFPGAPHGFSLIPGIRETEEANALAVAFLNKNLESRAAGEQ